MNENERRGSAAQGKNLPEWSGTWLSVSTGALMNRLLAVRGVALYAEVPDHK
jgi:hypothetical protein